MTTTHTCHSERSLRVVSNVAGKTIPSEIEKSRLLYVLPACILDEAPHRYT